MRQSEGKSREALAIEKALEERDLRPLPNRILARMMANAKWRLKTAEKALADLETADEKHVIAALDSDVCNDFLQYAASLMVRRGKRALRALERHKVIDTKDRRHQRVPLDSSKMHPGFLAELQSEHPFGGRWEQDPKNPRRKTLVFDKPETSK